MTQKDRDADRIDLGNPLGLGDTPARGGADHMDSSTDPMQRRKRARALGEDGIESDTRGPSDVNVDPDGAAGIDMGYGGEGTDVNTRRR